MGLDFSVADEELTESNLKVRCTRLLVGVVVENVEGSESDKSARFVNDLEVMRNCL